MRRFTVRPVLPEPLQPLTQLATNLRWSWHPPTQDLFAEIDPEAWRAVQRDPVRMIDAVEPARFDELARDSASVGPAEHAAAGLRAYLAAPPAESRQLEAPLASPPPFPPPFGLTPG